MPPIVAYATPLFIALIVLEIALVRGRAVLGFEKRDSATSLMLGLGNLVIASATAAVVLFVFIRVYEHRLFDIPRDAVWAWGLVIVADDFAYYWFHRLHHEVRLLWAAHVNHHSSRLFNLSTALRQSWTTPFTAPIFWLPLAFIGFEPVMIFSAQAISLVYQFWIHTEVIDRLGPCEWIFNTPSHHRVHHGRNLEYLDRNYAGIFIVWDRLFGSFEPERARVDYGITKNIESFNPLTVAFHEWRALLSDALHAGSGRDALRSLLEPPGWSPDGRSLTARQMQREAAMAVRASS